MTPSAAPCVSSLPEEGATAAFCRGTAAAISISRPDMPTVSTAPEAATRVGRLPMVGRSSSSQGRCPSVRHASWKREAKRRRSCASKVSSPLTSKNRPQAPISLKRAMISWGSPEPQNRTSRSSMSLLGESSSGLCSAPASMKTR